MEIRVQAFVRYFEDAEINGVPDEGGKLMPFSDGDCWRPIIELETGIVKGWPIGTKADIHYKVCDGFNFEVYKDGKLIAGQQDDYVPSFMCPAEEGYGDYIIMQIDENGVIQDWNKEIDLRPYEGCK